jgi:hypothetical protein
MGDGIDYRIFAGAAASAGSVDLPISAAFEHWLLSRLPATLGPAGEWAVDRVIEVADGLVGDLREDETLFEQRDVGQKSWGGRAITTDHLIGAMFMRGPIPQDDALALGILLGLIEQRSREELRALKQNTALAEALVHKPLGLPPDHEAHAGFCAALQISIESGREVELSDGS